ncbi:MAG: histidine phosphatase family protein [Myxococcota bacterium]|nr:histidine phosphatase family protein [Myxococcota bacterium]
MILRLALMRHAHSAWPDPRHTDLQRPLDERGRRTAPLVGRHLADIGWWPDRVACSPAARARETWTLASEGLEAVDFQVHETLYPGDPRAVVAILGELEEVCETLLIVAHNPGMEDCVQALAGEMTLFGTADVALLVRDPPEPWGDWRLDSVVRARAVAASEPGGLP